MGFHLGDIIDKTESGTLRGVQHEIACDCWFTRGGKSMPRLIKIMDEEGVLHTFPVNRVLTSEKKTYCGVQTVEHICQIPLGEREETVKLVFTKESCKWKLVVL